MHTLKPSPYGDAGLFSAQMKKENAADNPVHLCAAAGGHLLKTKGFSELDFNVYLGPRQSNKTAPQVKVIFELPSYAAVEPLLKKVKESDIPHTLIGNGKCELHIDIFTLAQAYRLLFVCANL
jgi:hypothetical protein